MDILGDSSHSVLMRINRECGIPDYVMSSEAFDKEAAAGLSDRLYADEFNRKYPLDSAADTWLSAAYFAKTAEDDGYSPRTYSIVRDNIKQAAYTYGIAEDVEKLFSVKKDQQSEKEAEDNDSNYGLPEKKLYPMFDEDGVKKACVHFCEYAFSFPYGMRHTISEKIFSKCAEYDIECPERVRKEAGIGVPDVDFMRSQVEDRIQRNKSEKYASMIREAMFAFDNSAAAAIPEALEKLASVIDESDRFSGLEHEYGKTYLAPSDFLYGISIKSASSMLDDTVNLNGVGFSVKKLAGLPVDVYANAMGDEFAEKIAENGKIDVSKLKEEIASLGNADRKAIFSSIRANTL